MTALIEVTLSFLFKNAKGRDAKLFLKGPAFTDLKEPTISITSPDCGETDATMSKDHTHDGSGKFPILEWNAPEDIAGQVKQWLLVSEDPDAPLPTPICHGLYLGIPPDKTRVEPPDFEIQDTGKGLLKGGFYYGKNRIGSVYGPPRPLMNHGVHRYFFSIIALNEPLKKELLTKKTSREEIAEAIRGKVLGWGLWVGRCERRWQ